MRALLFHCNKYGARFDSLATRPLGIIPENIKNDEQRCDNCIVAMITIENGDSTNEAHKITQDIIKMSDDVGHQNIVIAPFAHLSNNLAEHKTAIEMLNLIENNLSNGVYCVSRVHFGSHKSLLLDVFGHPGNIRYREY